ncbi:MAG: hypothetical protein AB8G23_23760 [Myxococcota bacterium]
MSEGEEAATRSLIVVDPDPAARNRAEDLEDDLEIQVIAMDSMEFETESSEEVLGASAFIIAWDLGIRSGLDLLEEIRRHESLADLPVLISTEAPVPGLVKCALQNGADSVCLRLYDGEEVKAKLAAATTAREAA